VAIKNEDIYVGAVYVSLDGTKSWLDLTLKLIKMKIDDCYIIKGVRKILVDGIEVKESSEIPSANLDSITAVCVLDEFGVFFSFKSIVINLLLCRVKVERIRDERIIRDGRRITRDGRRITRDGRKITRGGRKGRKSFRSRCGIFLFLFF
jgi:hypothetical protein